jgi:hypothetical protein
MNFIAGFLNLAFVIACFGVVIYLIMLASRLVSAHEKMAVSLDNIAQKLKDETKS